MKRRIGFLQLIILVFSGWIVPYALAVGYAMYGPGKGGIGKGVGAWFVCMFLHLIISMIYLGMKLSKNPA